MNSHSAKKKTRDALYKLHARAISNSRYNVLTKHKYTVDQRRSVSSSFATYEAQDLPMHLAPFYKRYDYRMKHPLLIGTQKQFQKNLLSAEKRYTKFMMKLTKKSSTN
jgi:hypothetical protein